MGDDATAETPPTLVGTELALRTERISNEEMIRICVNQHLFPEVKFVQIDQLRVSKRPNSLFLRMAHWMGRNTDDEYKARWDGDLKKELMNQMNTARSNKSAWHKEITYGKPNCLFKLYTLSTDENPFHYSCKCG